MIPITLSASLTALTSGVLTTIARSDKNIECSNPLSIPAGESITIKSKSFLRSLISFSTFSVFKISLSLV
jgi:hypothetical protein